MQRAASEVGAGVAVQLVFCHINFYLRREQEEVQKDPILTPSGGWLFVRDEARAESVHVESCRASSSAPLHTTVTLTLFHSGKHATKQQFLIIIHSFFAVCKQMKTTCSDSN